MHAEGVGLEDDDAVVEVGDEAGELVAFGVEEAEDVGVGVVEEAECAAVADGGEEALAEEGEADVGGVEGEDFADDGLVLVVAGGEPAAAAVDDVDEVAFGGCAFDAEQGSGEYPGVAAGDGFFLARGDDESGALHQSLSWWMVSAGSSLLKTALPATRTSAPAA